MLNRNYNWLDYFSGKSRGGRAISKLRRCVLAIGKISARQIRSMTGMEIAISGLKRRGFEPNVVLDIGAARGEWTRMASRYWPKTKYFLIEPLEERRSDLELLSSDFPGQIEFITAGASDSDGVLSLGVTDFLYDSSFAYAGRSSREVPVYSINSLYRQGRFKAPQFMKVDVQGFETKIVEGASEILPSCEIIILECPFFRFVPAMMPVHQVITWMAQKGFVPYEFFDFLRRPFDGAMGQCDIMFVREDHWLRDNVRWL